MFRLVWHEILCIPSPQIKPHPIWRTMALFKTKASALDSAWGSVLSSEALSAYTQSTRNIVKSTGGAKLAWAESKAEAVTSKRVIIVLFRRATVSLLPRFTCGARRKRAQLKQRSKSQHTASSERFHDQDCDNLLVNNNLLYPNLTKNVLKAVDTIGNYSK